MFKVGDRVERINDHNDAFAPGMLGTITVVNADGSYATVLVDGMNGYQSTGNAFCNLKITSKNINNMNLLIEKAKLAFKQEPEKSFIKCGVMDSSENLTPEGKELFLAYLLDKNKDDFKTTVVDPILAEEEANK